MKVNWKWVGIWVVVFVVAALMAFVIAMADGCSGHSLDGVCLGETEVVGGVRRTAISWSTMRIVYPSGRVCLATYSAGGLFGSDSVSTSCD